MPYGDCTLAAGSMYSQDGLDCIHEDPSMHLRSLRKEGIPPRFTLNKQRISVHGMEFNHTDAVTLHLALTSQSSNTWPITVNHPKLG